MNKPILSVGFLGSAALFLWGMTIAEKLHAAGYVLMLQAIVFVVCGLVNVTLPLVPRGFLFSWLWPIRFCGAGLAGFLIRSSWISFER